VVSFAPGEEDEQGFVEARIMRLGEWLPAASKAATAGRYDLPQASPRTVKLGLDGRPTRLPRLYTAYPVTATLSRAGLQAREIVVGVEPRATRPASGEGGRASRTADERLARAELGSTDATEA
jgi:hypothetical protein